MKKRTWISTLALGVILGTTLALPATASAHEFGNERPAKVFKIAGRHGDLDRGHWERRKVTSHHNSKHRSKHNKRDYRDQHRHGHNRRDYRPVKRHRGYGHKRGHHKQRHDRRGYRPVRQHRDHHRHREDGVRVHIDYDFRL
ncbi:hypothetical protein [Thiohalomonas denitrificans]|uniref:Uncharacterized protein n=1 Tax=Thiohalomonas denitrificans TaxID=415747 RepID=A0A1G5QV66_9GAMM|nr:hypothetical protein [Thiohalomonas denitrificans]SCZ65622.1 hypothetical protein SAMN03097708_02853 [Thiohalomonas denitrificans]